MLNNYPDVMTPEQVAAVLCISRKSVYRLLRERTIERNKYYVVLDRYIDGKRRQQWLSTGLTAKGNKRKAEQMLREKLSEAEKETAAPCADMLVSDCVRFWLTKAQHRVDEVTYRGYKQTAKTQILPYFDANGLSLRDCTVKKLQAYFDEKHERGRLDGKGGLSAKTMRHLRTILSLSFDEAIKEEQLAANPCKLVELPRKERYEAHFYSTEQLHKLFAVMKDDPMLPLVKITALYGLRRSEVLGLKWDSVDFTNGLVLIHHTVCKLGVKIEKDKTKTESSRRSFPMTAEARSIFLTAKAEEEENRRQFGRAYQANDYIFKWPDGTPFAPDYVTHHFAKVLKQNGLPHIRFHELRHSCASLLLNNGFALKDVQEWMGHSDIQTTANIYGHIDTARKRGMADKLASCLKDI